MAYDNTRQSAMPPQQGEEEEHPRKYQSSLPCRIGRCATSYGQGHHGGMMRDGGNDKMGERGAGGDGSYNTQMHTSTDHGGCHPPTAAMGRHSRLSSIQQSANILWDRATSLQQGRQQQKCFFFQMVPKFILSSPTCSRSQ